MRSINNIGLLAALIAYKNVKKIAVRSLFGYFIFIFVAAIASHTPLHAQQNTSCISDPEFSIANAERLISSNDPENRLTAALKIRECRSEEFSRLALPLLKDSDLLVRAIAVTSVSFLPVDEASNIIVPMLKDPSDFIRRESAFVLGKIGSSMAVKDLIVLLGGKEDIEVRSAAIMALGKIGSPDAISPLVSIMQLRPKEEDEFIRRSSARSIGQIAEKIRFGSTDSASPHSFLPPEHKPEFKTDGSLLNSYPQFNNALAILIRIVGDDNEAADTKREAVYAIGSIGESSTIPMIEKLAGDSDPFISETAREALQKLRSK